MDVSSIAAAATSYTQAKTASEASTRVAALANKQLDREGQAAVALLEAATEFAKQASAGTGKRGDGGVDVYA